MRFVLALLLAGCGAFPSLEPATCPDAGTTLTYENFGRDFMTRWCVACHGGVEGHSSRALNTVELVRAQAERTYANATQENAPMPPGPGGPSAEERAQLAQWLSCGAP